MRSSADVAITVEPLSSFDDLPAADLAAVIEAFDALRSGAGPVLGIGAGWHEGEHDAFGIPLPPMGERFDRLEATLGTISALFGLFQGGIVPSYAIIVREYFPPSEAAGGRGVARHRPSVRHRRRSERQAGQGREGEGGCG